MDSRPTCGWLQTFAVVLAGIAVISSALHFWPFGDSKMRQMLCPPNLVACAGILILVASIWSKRGRQAVASLLPHVSVLAYVSINALSVAFASDPGRAINFTAKLALMLLGGYALFSTAIAKTRSLRMLYDLTTVAVIISVASCLIGRFCMGSEAFGFHGSAFKYGTYIGVLVPFCSAYFLTGPRIWNILLGLIIPVAAIASSGTLGTLAAIFVAMVVVMIAIPRWPVRFCVSGSLVLGFGALLIVSALSPACGILGDLKLAEADEVNLRQRYIEWQAEINIMQKRTVTGTAAGCINDHRSKFYYRLPKLNTLKAFDQNGWLATGAETGLAGLVCFCWIVTYYGRAALARVVDSRHTESRADHRFATANFAGFAAACVANLFSSVTYNGILIVFVLLIALISRVHLMENETEC